MMDFAIVLGIVLGAGFLGMLLGGLAVMKARELDLDERENSSDVWEE